MPGQYTKFRNKLERRIETTPYAQKVEDYKQEILENIPKQDIAERIKHLVRRKDRLSKIEKKIEYESLAFNKALAAYLEASGEEQFKLSSGGSFTLSDKIYPSVKDYKALFDWAMENGHQNDLKLHPSTLSSIVGDALKNGRPLPDGVKVFIDLSVGVRGVKEKDNENDNNPED